MAPLETSSRSFSAQFRASYRPYTSIGAKTWNGKPRGEKIGSEHLDLLGSQPPHASRSARVAVTGTTTGASASLKKQRSGSNTGPTTGSPPPSNDPLWALLSAFADPGPCGLGTFAKSAAKGVASTAATAAAATAVVTGTAAGEGRGGVAGSRLSLRHPTGRGAATAEGVGAGAGGTATGALKASAAVGGGPLVVSVIATLRSGDARYLEEKALLEVRGWPSSASAASCSRRRFRDISFDTNCRARASS